MTLARCRESLRGAVGLLSLDHSDQSTPSRGERGAEAHTDAHHGRPSPELLREFRTVEQAYDELVTAISHEVKTSLTVIRGHAQLTARGLRRGDPPDPGAILAAMDRIDASTIRLLRELDGLTEDPARPPLGHP